ncbi:MAG: helix-turn-helix domain-containing protein [Egibacteraceae bacterium]
MSYFSSEARLEDTSAPDPLLFGQRLRHLRRERGLTLAQLGERVGRQAPYLSKLENGHCEPNLSLIGALATALETSVADLLTTEPPSRRAALEIELVRAQADPLYARLELPHLSPSARLPDVALEHLTRLFAELKRRSAIRAQTPEEARNANASLRHEMRTRGNYFIEIENVAGEVLESVGYPGDGPLSRRLVDQLAGHFGFTIVAVADLPSSVRSLTDLRNRRLYVPQRDELGTAAARSVVFQTLGHFALEHSDPKDFGEFLRQRVEANYFAGAMLVPEGAGVDFLQAAMRQRDLSVEDLGERFAVSYEMAAHRFTNLATRHLGIRTHFVRSDTEGVIWKAYENDDVPFPADPDGAIEGQRLCRRWGTRQVFSSPQRFATHYQFTDTPSGTFWCGTYLEAGREPRHAVTVGTRFADALHFRGRETDRRVSSGCPTQDCCRRPPSDLAARWEDYAWPSPRPHSHVLAALPVGTFPGVDVTEAYEFLDAHAQD